MGIIQLQRRQEERPLIDAGQLLNYMQRKDEYNSSKGGANSNPVWSDAVVKPNINEFQQNVVGNMQDALVTEYKGNLKNSIMTGQSTGSHIGDALVKNISDNAKFNGRTLDQIRVERGLKDEDYIGFQMANPAIKAAHDSALDALKKTQLEYKGDQIISDKELKQMQENYSQQFKSNLLQSRQQDMKAVDDEITNFLGDQQNPMKGNSLYAQGFKDFASSQRGKEIINFYEQAKIDPRDRKLAETLATTELSPEQMKGLNKQTLTQIAFRRANAQVEHIRNDDSLSIDEKNKMMLEVQNRTNSVDLENLDSHFVNSSKSKPYDVRQYLLQGQGKASKIEKWNIPYTNAEGKSDVAVVEASDPLDAVKQFDSYAKGRGFKYSGVGNPVPSGNVGAITQEELAKRNLDLKNKETAQIINVFDAVKKSKGIFTFRDKTWVNEANAKIGELDLSKDFRAELIDGDFKLLKKNTNGTWKILDTGNMAYGDSSSGESYAIGDKVIAPDGSERTIDTAEDIKFASAKNLKKKK